MIDNVLDGNLIIKESMSVDDIDLLFRKGTVTVGDLRGFLNDSINGYGKALMHLVYMTHHVASSSNHYGMKKYRENGVLFYIADSLRSIGVHEIGGQPNLLYASTEEDYNDLLELIMTESIDLDVAKSALWYIVHFVEGGIISPGRGAHLREIMPPAVEAYYDHLIDTRSIVPGNFDDDRY